MFARVQSISSEFNRLQSNLATALIKFFNNPFLNGAILEDQALINGTTIIQHGLGRQMQGWVVTNINASASIYSTGMTSKTLTLVSSADATISLYVF